MCGHWGPFAANPNGQEACSIRSQHSDVSLGKGLVCSPSDSCSPREKPSTLSPARSFSFFSFFNGVFEAEGIYKVSIISAVPQGDSLTHEHTSIVAQLPLPHRPAQNTAWSFPGCAAGRVPFSGSGQNARRRRAAALGSSSVQLACSPSAVLRANSALPACHSWQTRRSSWLWD